MKKIKLLFQMMIVCFVFLMCMFKNTSKAYAGLEQVECVVYKIEICNICGHDFNSVLCSHTMGASYGGSECKPYEEKYCNICGENMVYCTHEEGVEYGGVECKPWERCNICGNNYFDAGGACSHEKGSYYGGTECIPKEIYVCSICGDNYWGGDCPHSEGAWYDEGYCELDKITICNICGNNYFDEYGACSHRKGQVYGDVECSTTTICNICGNNYYDPNGACSHWEGNSYGGTVCEANKITFCNICGNNYYDPNGACSHWDGQIYGNTICATTEKMFCSVCKDEYDKCLHIRGKEYKNIAYYFYIEDRKEQSESDVADLITIKEDESNPYNYKNKIYEVVKFETNNEEKFREAWENVGKFNESACCVYAVMMNMHGTPTEISNGSGKGYSLRMNIDDINSLERKSVQRLILLQCSVGNIDYVGENIASAFAKKISGQVLAGDAEVNVKKYYKLNSRDDANDQFFSEKSEIYVRYEAVGNGWYFYKYDLDEKSITYTKLSGNSYRIYQLINMFSV